MKSLVLRGFLFIFISVNGFAQTIKLSAGEKCWAIFHPFAALKVNKINKKASAIYKPQSLKLLLDTFSNGGKLDAFRHTFYMAAFAQKIKVKKIRKLGIAHEKSNFKQFLKSQAEEGELGDSLSSVMDLQNNELGFKTGRNNKKTDLETLKKIVIESINKGQAVIMKRNKKGNYLDCNNQKIKIIPSEKKWFVPKCLVNSDYDYID